MTGKPKFDATINLGHVLTIVTMIVAIAGGYTKVQISIVELRKDIFHYGEKVADFEQRLRALERR